MSSNSKESGIDLKSVKNDFAESTLQAVGSEETKVNLYNFEDEKTRTSKRRNKVEELKYLQGKRFSSLSESMKEGDKMDENKILEMYINKVDKDQYDLKQDVRESEKRLENHIIQSEKRMEDRLNRIEELIISQNSKFEKMDDKLGEVSKDVAEKLEEYRKFLWGIAFSIFLAIAAMIVSIIVS